MERIKSRTAEYQRRLNSMDAFLEYRAAHNLDGSDPHIRLEAYMAEERGGKDSWRVEYCYLM